MALETWDFSVLAPAELEIGAITHATEMPVTLTGIPGVVDFSFGGYWFVRYVFPPFSAKAKHLYWNKWARRLNSGAQALIVPFHTAITKPTVTATLDGLHTINAGTITFIVATGGDEIVGGEFFSINHITKSHRVYGIYEVDSVEDIAEGKRYTVGIQPPLREQTADTKVLDFSNPRCVMRLQPKTTMPWLASGPWLSQPSVAFVEAFGALELDFEFVASSIPGDSDDEQGTVVGSFVASGGTPPYTYEIL